MLCGRRFESEMDNKEVQKIVGENIKYIMDEKGMGIQEFSNYINVKRQHLLKVIKGEAGFSIKKILEISEITKFPLEFILTGKKVTMGNEVKEKLNVAEKHAKAIKDIIDSMGSLIE